MKTLPRLSDGYIYQTYDNTIDLTNKMIELSKTSQILDTELSEQISQIERRYGFPLKNKVIEDFKSHRVILLYNEKGVRLPSTIPAYLMNNGKTLLSCVNMSNYINKNKNGEFHVDTKILYSYMQAGTILASCYQKYQSMINKSSIIKLGSSIYSKLFTKVINKMFTLNVTPAKIDVINFLSSWFFIHRVLGRDSATVTDINKRYALENCKSANRLTVESYINDFDPEVDFVNLDTFIQSLAKNIHGLEDITTRGFVDSYIMSYGPAMMLSLEYLPIFFANIGFVSVGAFLNNQHPLENLFENEGEKLLKELVTI